MKFIILLILGILFIAAIILAAVLYKETIKLDELETRNSIDE